jgi:Putative Se/S carrier protein-like
VSASPAPEGVPRGTLVFDSTTAALWAEEVAGGAGIPVEVVPAPADSDARCDLALETFLLRLPELEDALTTQGVPYRRWPSV